MLMERRHSEPQALWYVSVKYAASNTLVVGWEFDEPAIFRPSRKRVWRARLAIREALRVSKISGRLMERIVGHLCFISQGRREIFSVFGAVFGLSSEIWCVGAFHHHHQHHLLV